MNSIPRRSGTSRCPLSGIACYWAQAAPRGRRQAALRGGCLPGNGNRFRGTGTGPGAARFRARGEGRAGAPRADAKRRRRREARMPAFREREGGPLAGGAEPGFERAAGEQDRPASGASGPCRASSASAARSPARSERSERRL